MLPGYNARARRTLAVRVRLVCRRRRATSFDKSPAVQRSPPPPLMHQFRLHTAPEQLLRICVSMCTAAPRRYAGRPNSYECNTRRRNLVVRILRRYPIGRSARPLPDRAAPAFGEILPPTSSCAAAMPSNRNSMEVSPADRQPQAFLEKQCLMSDAQRGQAHRAQHPKRMPPQIGLRHHPHDGINGLSLVETRPLPHTVVGITHTRVRIYTRRKTARACSSLEPNRKSLLPSSTSGLRLARLMAPHFETTKITRARRALLAIIQFLPRSFFSGCRGENATGCSRVLGASSSIPPLCPWNLPGPPETMGRSARPLRLRLRGSRP